MSVFYLRIKGMLNPVHTYKPKACICGRDCEHMLHHLRTVYISFATNRNWLFFLHEHKGDWVRQKAPSVLCSSQVCRKLIYHVPNTNCSRTVWFVCGSHVYSSLYTLSFWTMVTYVDGQVCCNSHGIYSVTNGCYILQLCYTVIFTPCYFVANSTYSMTKHLVAQPILVLMASALKSSLSGTGLSYLRYKC